MNTSWCSTFESLLHALKPHSYFPYPYFRFEKCISLGQFPYSQWPWWVPARLKPRFELKSYRGLLQLYSMFYGRIESLQQSGLLVTCSESQFRGQESHEWTKRPEGVLPWAKSLLAASNPSNLLHRSTHPHSFLVCYWTPLYLFHRIYSLPHAKGSFT